MTLINPSAPSLSLLQAVLNIARDAGDAIMQVYTQSELGIELKADDSPLTLADRRAHALIVAELAQLTPDIPVLSEESPTEHHLPHVRQQWPTLWIVDPLDGTREFISRNGEFTVNIALVHQHRAVLGVVTAPALGVGYAGIPGLGAFRTPLNEMSLESIKPRPYPTTPVVVGSRSHRGDSLDAMLTKLGPHELYAVGSALKFCQVAAGLADLYPRLSPTSEWDTAAGQAVLEAAGGQVSTLQGAPLRYNQRDTLLNPHFMAVGDAGCQWQRLM